jgi:1,4-alpha-glucan branching enzyme
MPLKKNYLKSKNICRVTFNCPVTEADQAYLVGDFNSWDTEATPMKKSKQGFSATLDLEPGQDYQFRYFLSGDQWANDDSADAYTDTPFPDARNSVVNIS